MMALSRELAIFIAPNINSSEAIAELEKSEAAVEIFGQDVVDHYLNAARVEQEVYDSVVHDWDRERYLERS